MRSLAAIPASFAKQRFTQRQHRAPGAFEVHGEPIAGVGRWAPAELVQLPLKAVTNLG
jgi:ParB-like chromosome segregation protein Spo0J